MDQVALRIEETGDWTYLGGDETSKKPLEVVVRAFEGDASFAVGSDASGPGPDAVTVARGEGRRLQGRHFFVRPTPPRRHCLLSYRGL